MGLASTLRNRSRTWDIVCTSSMSGFTVSVNHLMGRQWLKARMAYTPAYMECGWMKVWQQGIVQLYDGPRLRLTHRGHGENLSLHEFHVFALKASQGDELFVSSSVQR